MFSGLESPTHLLIVLLIILLLFGAKRLPELGRSLGQGIKELKEGLNAKEEPQKKHASVVEEVEASKKAYDKGGPYQKGETAHTRETDL
jgi:sec-independent protein translocase protein TatA